MKKKSGFLMNMRNTMLFFTVFSLWISVYFKEETEDILAYFLILSLGILHGTNDIKLIEKESNKKNKTFNRKIVFLFYLLLILVGILSFYFIPAIALLIFIIFSAYHFGEQHWVAKLTKQSNYKNFLHTFYGMLVLGILFFSNSTEVSIVIKNISNINVPRSFYLYTSITSLLIIATIIVKLSFSKEIHLNVWEELFYLLLFYIVFNTASLLWSFAIYFVFWHSIPSLANQVYFIYGNYKRESFINYLKSSFTYWLASIMGLAILYLIFQNQDRLFLSIFFTSIAAITFPHVWIMSKLNK